FLASRSLISAGLSSRQGSPLIRSAVRFRGSGRTSPRDEAPPRRSRGNRRGRRACCPLRKGGVSCPPLNVPESGGNREPFMSKGSSRRAARPLALVVASLASFASFASFANFAGFTAFATFAGFATARAADEAGWHDDAALKQAIDALVSAHKELA